VVVDIDLFSKEEFDATELKNYLTDKYIFQTDLSRIVKGSLSCL
jgi:hypothetical protein